MKTPKYHMNRAKNASTSRVKSTFNSRSSAKFVPTPGLDEYLDDLVAEGKLTRDEAKACRQVRTAKQFDNYCRIKGISRVLH